MKVLLFLFTGEIIESVHELQHLEVSQVTITEFIKYMNIYLINLIKNFNHIIKYRSNTPCDVGSNSFLQNTDKEKQKSEAKHIGQKKRKALSDLFKELTQLGKETGSLTITYSVEKSKV